MRQLKCNLFLVISFLFCTAILAGQAAAIGFGTTNPNEELRPSYEEEPLPEAVPAGLYLKPAEFAHVPREIIADEDFDAVFERLVNKLPQTGLAVNTANPKTGIITAARRTANPETMVDLGITTRTYGSEAFVFPTAAAAKFKLPYQNKNEQYYAVSQTTSLNCLANIQLTRLKNERTKVLVTVNYQFTLNTSFENTAFRKSAPPAETKTITFLTNERKEADLGIMDTPFIVTPQSNGRLERAILDIAAKP